MSGPSSSVPPHCSLPPCSALIDNAIKIAQQKYPDYEDHDPRNDDIDIRPLEGLSGPRESYPFSHLVPGANGCQCSDCGQVHSASPLLKANRTHPLPESNLPNSVGHVTTIDEKCNRCFIDKPSFKPLGVILYQSMLIDQSLQPQMLSRSLKISEANKYIVMPRIINNITRFIRFEEKAPVHGYPGVSVPAVLAGKDVLIDSWSRPLKSHSYISVFLNLPYYPVTHQCTILTTCAHNSVNCRYLATQLCMLLRDYIDAHKNMFVGLYVFDIERLRLVSLYSNNLEHWFLDLAYL